MQKDRLRQLLDGELTKGFGIALPKILLDRILELYQKMKEPVRMDRKRGEAIAFFAAKGIVCIEEGHPEKGGPFLSESDRPPMAGSRGK